MKIKALFAATIMVITSAFSLCSAYGASFEANTTAIVQNENFESYNPWMEGDWSTSASAGVYKPQVKKLGDNKVFEIFADTATRQETYYDLNYDATKMNTLVYGFSIYIDDLASSVYTSVRTGQNSSISFKLSSAGRLLLCDKSTDIYFEQDKWYEVVIEHVLSTGYMRAQVNGGEGTKIADAIHAITASTSAPRMSFICDKVKTEGAQSRIYLDNFYAYGSDKIPTGYMASPEGYTFEDFESSENGLTFPEGIADDNANTEYINVYTAEGCNSEKALKVVSNTAKKYPTLRTTLSAISGKSILEFDYMPTEASRPRFGIRGNKKDGSGVGAAVHLFGMFDGGELVFAGPGGAFKEKTDNDDVLIATLTPDNWYHFKIEFDTDAYTFDITVSGDALDEAAKLSGEIPVKTTYENTYIIKYFDMYYFGETSVDYIDNIVFRKNISSFGVMNIFNANSVIHPDSGIIEVACSDDLESSVSEMVYKLNGDENAFDVLVSGKTVTLTPNNPLDFDSRYFVEICGTDNDGNEFYYPTSLRTLKKLDISEFYASHEEIQSGEISSNVTITSNSGDYANAIIITVLYEKISGKIVSAVLETANLEQGVETKLSTTTAVPDDFDNYKAVTYLWDSIGEMNTLCEPLVLE